MDEKELAEQMGRRIRGFLLNQMLRHNDVWAVLGIPHNNLSASLPLEPPCQKDKKRRAECVSISADQKKLQAKHHQLSASLARVRRLIQELFAQGMNSPKWD